MAIEKSTLKFVRDLEKNNNRSWFNDNKGRYQEAQENVKSFLASVESEMNKFDEIEKTKLFRVYRDVRFSKDKTPYNADFRMSLSRVGKERRGGYYVKIGGSESYVACGFWGPESKDMKLIRDHISADPKPLRKIIKAKKFVDTFRSLEGEQVKSAPKGFSKDDPSIDLLRYKQFLMSRKIKNSVVTTDQFLKEVIKTYKAVRPFFDYMSEILTHDLNGRPLY